MGGLQMNGQRTVILFTTVLLLVAAGVVCLMLQPPVVPDVPTPPHPEKPQPPPVSSPQSGILWRMPLPTTVNRPTALSTGWLVTDNAGPIFSLTEDGQVRWRASYSNAAWEVSAEVNAESVCAITQKGHLYLFDASTGAVRWSCETGLSCQHPPLPAMIDNDPVLILLSQDDGILACVNVRDGTLRWRSQPTNRTDSPAVCTQHEIAYGNCDAAVHLFSLTNGQLKGSIPLNDDEQIAGGILPLPTGLLVVGTRTGALTLLDPEKMECIARMKISESEAFATPALLTSDRFVMPVPEGKLTFWKVANRQLVADGELPLAERFNESVIYDNTFWCIANRLLCAVRLGKDLEPFTLSPGDDLKDLSPGLGGKSVLLVDGELICVKGF
jgi:hypothetical protein